MIGDDPRDPLNRAANERLETMKHYKSFDNFLPVRSLAHGTLFRYEGKMYEVGPGQTDAYAPLFREILPNGHLGELQKFSQEFIPEKVKIKRPKEGGR